MGGGGAAALGLATVPASAALNASLPVAVVVHALPRRAALAIALAILVSLLAISICGAAEFQGVGGAIRQLMAGRTGLPRIVSLLRPTSAAPLLHTQPSITARPLHALPLPDSPGPPFLRVCKPKSWLLASL